MRFVQNAYLIRSTVFLYLRAFREDIHKGLSRQTIDREARKFPVAPGDLRLLLQLGTSRIERVSPEVRV